MGDEQREPADLIRISISTGDGPHESQWASRPPAWLEEAEVDAYLDEMLYGATALPDWQHIVFVYGGVPFASWDRIHVEPGERLDWRRGFDALRTHQRRVRRAASVEHEQREVRPASTSRDAEWFKLLVAALGGCGCHAEAKELKAAATAGNSALSAACDSIVRRPGFDAEAAELIGSFISLCAESGDAEVFRERCYRALGVR